MTGSRELESDPLKWLQFTAAVSAAFFLNGLIVWELVLPDRLEGMRGIISAGVAFGLLAVLGTLTGGTLRRDSVALAVLIVCQLFVIVVALFAPGATDYGLWKVRGFVLFAVVPSLLLLWVGPRRPRVVASILLAMCVLSLAAVPPLLGLGVDGLLGGYVPWLLLQEGLDPISLGRTLGLGAFLAVAFAAGHSGVIRFSWVTAAVVLVTGQLLVGERGPVAALIISVMTYMLLGMTLRAGARRPALRVMATLSLVVAAVVLLPRAVPRFGLDVLATDVRQEIFLEGLEAFADRPLFGTGIGGFVWDSSSPAERQYFHNISGELLSETGLAGLACFLLFLLFIAREARRGWRELTGRSFYWHRVSVGLAVFALIAAQVSGDLTTNYMVWVSAVFVHCTASARPGSLKVTAAERFGLKTAWGRAA